MRGTQLARTTAVVSCLALTLSLGVAQAQQPAPEFTPHVGQPGKDVVWVPTASTLVDLMLDMAKVTADDYVIDLGSGDGRTVIAAAKRGARAHGIEYNPDMVVLSKRNAEKEGVTDKATFVEGDIFESDFSDATVLTLFLLPDLNRRLRPTILDMKPGTRVVSNTFDMGDWSPDQTGHMSEGCTSHCTALFWIVPAKVDGSWSLGNGTLELSQHYQTVTGSLIGGNVKTAIAGKLTGDRITFQGAGVVYTGQVADDVIEGTATTPEGERNWRATRAVR